MEFLWKQIGIGIWEGEFQRVNAVWLRFYTAAGQLVLTRAEAAEQRVEMERQQAEAANQRVEMERQQAEAANQRAEMERQRAERLAAKLRELGIALEA